jgi:hypothetical protein
MTSKASTLLFSVMSSIDEIKDKINDGEYLNLCNLLKSLNDEIKTPSENARQVMIDAIERAQQEETQETNRDIEHMLGDLINDPRYFDDNNNYIVNPREILQDYNNLLTTIEEEHNESNNHQWFNCACGCCLRTSDISEHITTEDHIENFIMWSH